MECEAGGHFTKYPLMRAGRVISTPCEASIVEIVRARTRSFPDGQIFCFLQDGEFESDWLTYGELHKNACRIANLLLQSADPGDRALLLYPPGLELISGLFGCWYAGIIAVPAALPRLSWVAADQNPMAAIAADCRPRAVLIGGETSEKIRELCTADPDLQGVVILRTDENLPITSNDENIVPVSPETVALVQYTSGSTGDPRGVILTHENILQNEFVIQSAFGHDTNSRDMTGVCWLPFQHDMGLIGNVLQSLYVDGMSYIMSPLQLPQRPYCWLQAISRYRAHTSGGPNFAYDLCAGRITEEQKRTLDLSCWEVAYVGAEPISPATLERFATAFAPCGFRPEAFYPCYGLAEATLMVSGGELRSRPVIRSFAIQESDSESVQVACEHSRSSAVAGERPIETLVGCGHAWHEHEVVIVDPRTRMACPPGQVGEIWFRGPSVARGYWNREAESQETFGALLSGSVDDRFLRTGDVGFLHEGELFVSGRLKDLIVIHGRNYHPQDIEQTVGQIHPSFRPRSAAAFGCVIDGEERLIILQEIKARATDVNVDELERTVRNAVAARQQIQAHAIMFVKAGSLPKTTSGKIRRQECKRRYLHHLLIAWMGKTQSHDHFSNG